MLQSFYPVLCASLSMPVKACHTHARTLIYAYSHILTHSHNTHAFLTQTYAFTLSHTNSHILIRQHILTKHSHTHPHIRAHALAHSHRLQCTHILTLTPRFTHMHTHSCTHTDKNGFPPPPTPRWFVPKLLIQHQAWKAERQIHTGWGAAAQRRPSGPHSPGRQDTQLGFQARGFRGLENRKSTPLSCPDMGRCHSMPALIQISPGVFFFYLI